MDMIHLFGFALTGFIVPFLSEIAKTLAKRLLGEQQKSLPNPSTNVVVVIFVFYL